MGPSCNGGPHTSFQSNSNGGTKMMVPYSSTHLLESYPRRQTRNGGSINRPSYNPNHHPQTLQRCGSGGSSSQSSSSLVSFLPSISSKSQSSRGSSNRHDRCLQPSIHTALLFSPIYTPYSQKRKDDGENGGPKMERQNPCCLPPMRHPKRKDQVERREKRSLRGPRDLSQEGHRRVESNSPANHEPLQVNGVEKSVQKRVISRQGYRRGFYHRNSPQSKPPTNNHPPAQSFCSTSASTSVQTDEYFDEAVNGTVRELADRAIADAISSLKIEVLQTQMNKSQMQHQRTARLLRRQLSEKEQKLVETEKRLKDLRKSHQIALDACQLLTIKAIKNLETLNESERKVRSIASGLTRNMTVDYNGIDIIYMEINKDFFPWLFSRAESAYRRKQTINDKLFVS